MDLRYFLISIYSKNSFYKSLRIEFSELLNTILSFSKISGLRIYEITSFTYFDVSGILDKIYL